MFNIYLVVARDNLYNTNDKFDYGGFRELMEAQSQIQTATSLFAYRWTDPGAYVFYLSSDVNKKTVITKSIYMVIYILSI
jgi:hypothetical protein